MFSLFPPAFTAVPQYFIHISIAFPFRQMVQSIPFQQVTIARLPVSFVVLFLRTVREFRKSEIVDRLGGFYTGIKLKQIVVAFVNRRVSQ